MINELMEIGKSVKEKVDDYLEKKFDEAGKVIKIGADGTPTSNIDLVAENEVFRIVKEKDLPFNVLSEEYGYWERNKTLTLVLDPLDGSFNAERNIPFYSISMAVMERDMFSTKYALVMNLVSGKSYWAEKGKGAYFENRRINTKKGDGEKLSVISLGKNVNERVFDLIKNSRRVRSMGCASLEMLLVAEGVADVFVYDYSKKGVLRIIDIAASSFIVREAGGEVFDADTMEPLNMDLNLLERKNVIAIANREKNPYGV